VYGTKNICDDSGRQYFHQWETFAKIFFQPSLASIYLKYSKYIQICSYFDLSFIFFTSNYQNHLQQRQPREFDKKIIFELILNAKTWPNRAHLKIFTNFLHCWPPPPTGTDSSTYVRFRHAPQQFHSLQSHFTLCVPRLRCCATLRSWGVALHRNVKRPIQHSLVTLGNTPQPALLS
jgi:hypothetical protein